MNRYKEFLAGLRNYILLFLAVPVFSGIYVKAQNRKVVQEVQAMVSEGKDFVGQKFGDYKVVVGKTGTLKMEDTRFKHAQH